MTNKINFFKEAVKSMKTSGTVAPSSRFLAKKMLKGINFSKVDVIVELGPGNGAITKYILKKLPPNATLICFEVNENFYNQLVALDNPQLVVLKASAEDIEGELNKLKLLKVKHIISSLPLTIIPEEISDEILRNSFNVLENGGVFVQFQYSLAYFKKIKKIFNTAVSLDFEVLNFPPAFIYRCKKVL